MCVLRVESKDKHSSRFLAFHIQKQSPKGEQRIHPYDHLLGRGSSTGTPKKPNQR